MKHLALIAALLAFALPAQAAEKIDPEFKKFWGVFREAVLKKDKEAVADMTKLPMVLNGKPRDRAGFIKMFNSLFDTVRKQMSNPEIAKDQQSGSYFVFCGEEILVFAKVKGRYLFTDIGMND